MKKAAGEPFVSPRPREKHAATLLLSQCPKRVVHGAIGVVGKVLIAENIVKKAGQCRRLWGDAMGREGALCGDGVDERAFIAREPWKNEGEGLKAISILRIFSREGLQETHHGGGVEAAAQL